MRNRFIRLTCLLVLVAHTVLGTVSASEGRFDVPIQSDFEAETNHYEDPKIKADINDLEPEVIKTNAEVLLDKLHAQLAAHQSTFNSISDTLENTQDRMYTLAKESRTLKGQLDILNAAIEETTHKTENVRTHIAQIELDLEALGEEIAVKELELAQQRDLLSEYVQFLYYQQNLFFEGKQNDLNLIKLLMATDTVSGSMRNSRYLVAMEEHGREILDTLAGIKKVLDNKTAEQNRKMIALNALNERLSLELKLQKEQEAAKNELYEKTKGKEDLYKQLLIYAKIEQQQVLQDIQEIDKNLSYLKANVNNLNDDEVVLFEQKVNEVIKKNYLMSVSAGDIGNLPQFSWPAFPGRGISAYFKDENYPFPMEHRAIDIPIPQGTPIHAPAAGIVTKVVNNRGNGYHYIIVSHKDNFNTLYGHVYESSVSVGDAIQRGDILGFSGGIPGTRGAGIFTTGAHLHFELFKDGVQVDPLLFLPLRYIPFKYLPEKYHELLDLEKEKLAEAEASIWVDSISNAIDEELSEKIESAKEKSE